MKIVLHNRTSQLLAPEPVLKWAREHFRARSANWFWQCRDGKWDGYYQFISPGGKFHTGLWQRIKAQTEAEMKAPVEVEDERQRPPFEPSAFLGFGYDLRQEQTDAVATVLREGGCTFHAATNSGKTDVAIALAHALGNLRVLFLTHRKVLLHQISGRFEEALREPVGRIGDGLWSTKRVTVGMIETLAPGLLTAHDRHVATRELLSGADLIVWDECHRSSKGDWWKIAGCVQKWSTPETPGPYWSLAMSGTADVGDDLTKMRLEALSGPTLARITNAEQIAKGHSAAVHVVVLNVRTPREVVPSGEEPMKYAEARKEFGYVNFARSRLIAEAAGVMASFGLPCFLATENKIWHHPCLRRALEEEGVRVASLTGDMGTEDRDASCKALIEGRADLLLSTTVLDEGWDVPMVYGVFDAGTQASGNATLQRLGRGIRRKAEGPNVLLHFVCGDWTCKALAEKSKKRLGILAKEGAFTFYQIDRGEELRPLLESLGFTPCGKSLEP